MKKQALLLMAGGLISFASCTTETHESDVSETQIDSAVNARVEEIRMEMMRQNDSLINAMAQVKADSIIAAMKGSSSVTTKTTTTRTTTVKPSSKAVSGTTSTTTGGAASSSTGSVSDRKSTQQAQQNADVTNRKSTQQSQQNSDVTNRKSKGQ